MPGTADGFRIRSGLHLAAALDAAGRRQADVARRTGLSAATLSRVVNGRQVPSPPTCEKLAAALGLDLFEMLRVAGHIASTDGAQAAEGYEPPGLAELADLTPQELSRVLEYALLLKSRRG